MGEASELLHSRLGIEDPELVILNVNLKSREGCTESVRFDKCTHGPSLPANKKATKVVFLFARRSKQTALLTSRNRTAGSCFSGKKNRRAGLLLGRARLRVTRQNFLTKKS